MLEKLLWNDRWHNLNKDQQPCKLFFMGTRTSADGRIRTPICWVQLCRLDLDNHSAINDWSSSL